VLRRQLALDQRCPQPHRGRIGIVVAGEAGIEAIEQRELLLRRQRGVIGNVVGGAHEIVERKDRSAMARVNKPGRHRKIFVPVTLARS